MNGALRRLWPLIAVGALLATAALASALSPFPVAQAPLSLHPARPRTMPTPPDHPVPRSTGSGKALSQAQSPIQLGWLGGVLEVLCIVAVVAAAGVLIFLLVRNSLSTGTSRLLVEHEKARPPARRDEVLAAVDAGLSDLDDNDGDPRRAVIACWVRLEQAAAAAGTPRQAGDSPTDLVGRLLGAHQVSAAVLYQLADVYRVARYATRTVDSGMREAARSALRQLRAELTTSQSGPLENAQ